MTTKQIILKPLLKLSVVAISISLLTSCGQKNASSDSELIANNIVGGKNMKEKLQQETGVVGLVIVTEEGTGICSGSLISKRIILTAAHCIEEAMSGPIKKVFAVFTNDLSKATPDRIRGVITGVPHEAFMSSIINSAPTWSDIALLKLSEDAPADFKLTRLPAANLESKLKKGLKLKQAGFGRTEARRDVESDTSGVLRHVDGIELISLSEDGKELLLKEDGKGSCNGDSGGPAYAKGIDGKLVQVGINSRGTSQTTCIEVGVYTNVLAHLDWIKTKSEQLMALPDIAPAPIAPVAPAPSIPTSN